MAGPDEVIVTVRRQTPVCPPPACAGRGTECPALDRYIARLDEERAAAQVCVRAVVAAVEGTASAATGSDFTAMLTWPQIMAVAAHPHVASISPRFEGFPPRHRVRRRPGAGSRTTGHHRERRRAPWNRRPVGT
jgi:hypothetical protein